VGRKPGKTKDIAAAPMNEKNPGPISRHVDPDKAPPLIFTFRVLQQACHGSHGPGLEQTGQGDVPAEYRFDPGKQENGRKGVPAKIKKVVLRPDGGDPQHFLPQGGKPRLRLALRRGKPHREFGARGSRIREPCSIGFSVPCSRHFLQQDKPGGKHEFGQGFLEAGSQPIGSQP
jgi:hypothetical protein